MFTTRNYSSEERYDLAKVLNFVDDAYDMLNSPFLNKFKTLPVVGYYSVRDGYKNIDQVSQEVYGSIYYSFYLMYFNDLFSEILPENITLNLFSLTDMDNLYQNINIGII